MRARACVRALRQVRELYPIFPKCSEKNAMQDNGLGPLNHLAARVIRSPVPS